jgi:hypothetical protein
MRRRRKYQSLPEHWQRSSQFVSFVATIVDPQEVLAMRMSWQLRLWLWVLAVATSLTICISTGLITAWGYWYSPSLAYRKQTDALFEGHFALSNNPAATEFDMAWSKGGVQQVWGLGVPAWRLPFELLARAIGQSMFPDRVALAVAISLTCYFCLCTFTLTSKPRASGLPEKNSPSENRRNRPVNQQDSFAVQTLTSWLRNLTRNPTGFVAVILLIGFPPVLTICRGRFNVYEEPIVYEYFFSIALFTGAISLARNPGFVRFLTICLLAGLTGFVRPTALAYGFATFFVAILYTTQAPWRWRQRLLGVVLFAGPLALLFSINLARFGSLMEFGHHLNMTDRNIIYCSRFGAPFDHEPLWSAGKELLGAIFFAYTFNDHGDGSDSNLAVWQSETPRRRNYTATTFDLSYLLALVAYWAWFFVRFVNARIQGKVPFSTPQAVPAIWSIVAFFPIFAFYLRYCALFSRYLLDFAPAIAAALVGGVCALAASWNRIRLPRPALVGVVVLWWVWQMLSAENASVPLPALSRTQVNHDLQHRSSRDVQLPPCYDLHTNSTAGLGLTFNGLGWDRLSGQTEPVVVLFVDNLKQLIVEIVPVAHESRLDYGAVKAQLGLVALSLDSIENSAQGTLLKFTRPARKDCRSGIQALFLSFARPSDFRNASSHFRLLKVEWKQ